MTLEEFENCLKAGEGIRIEFKRASTSCPSDLYETVVSFSNKEGGTILLGVSDDGQPKGIEPDSIANIKKDITNTCNNSEKINPVISITPIDFEYKGRKFLILKIPVSSQVHKHAGVIYDRENDSDIKITDQTRVSEIYFRKRNVFTEAQIYSAVTMSDLRADLFEIVRKIIRLAQPNHDWLLMNDMELLRSASLYYKDFQTGKEGFSLAAVLLFGKDETIQSILPAYKVEALVRRDNLDRWDDRLTLRTNLIDTYTELMNFIRKHLPTKFYLEADQRKDLRDIIFRELIGNMLCHREYTSNYSTELIIYRDKVISTNPNKALFHGLLDVHAFSPYAKNPNIRKFFSVLSWADELGSGVRNMTRYVPMYVEGAKPIFLEDDIFRTEIPLIQFTWRPFAKQFITCLGNIPAEPTRVMLENLSKIAVTDDPTKVSFEQFLLKKAASWAGKGTKVPELQILVNKGISENNLKKVPSYTEKGTKLFNKRTLNLLKIILMTLKPAALTKIMDWIGYKNRKQFRELYLKSLIQGKLIEYTLPAKPSSEKQKYVITEKGRRFLGGFDI